MNRWQNLHTKMLTDIEICLQGHPLEIEQVESAFRIAIEYWQQLKDLLKMHRFASRNEEIGFYKNIKPAFTSYIQYFAMVYAAHILKPADIADLHSFWKNESTMLDKYIDKDPDFIEYYRNGNTHLDFQYFLPPNYDVASRIVTKPAGLLAQEMYHEYVQVTLKSLQKILPAW